MGPSFAAHYFQYFHFHFKEDDVTFELDAGVGDNDGFVRVNYRDGYGYVCDDFWDLTDANVVCKQLGFEGADEAYIGGTVPVAGAAYYLDNLNCTGDEASLLYCTHGGFGSHDCSTDEAASVVCTSSQSEFWLDLRIVVTNVK